ncbi:MAG: FMN-dependent NADH-azoreductase [bacterium]
MTQLLRVDASMRQVGSHSRTLTDKLVHKLVEKQSYSVITRDLAAGVPMVNEAWIAANFTAAEARSSEHKAALAASDALVAELRAAAVVVIGLPIYNFGVPAAFKAWIDMVTRAKETFEYTVTGPRGLLEGKSAYVVLTSGGTALGSAADFVSPWLKHVLAFIGIEDLQVIDASAVLFDEAGVLARAQAQIDTVLEV